MKKSFVFLYCVLLLLVGCSKLDNSAGEIALGLARDRLDDELGAIPAGTSSFMSSQVCKSLLDCKGEFNQCFEGKCTKVNEDLRTYIETNYPQAEYCGNVPCEGCKNGKLITASIGNDDIDIAYCKECSDGSSTLGCAEGYTCKKSKCMLQE